MAWRSSTSFLSNKGKVGIEKMSTDDLMKEAKKGRKLLLQRIERINKAVERGEIKTNYLKERYEKYKLGKLKGLSREELQTKVNYMKDQINRKTSTIQGTKMYEFGNRIIQDNVELNESEKSDLFKVLREFEKGAVSFVKDYESQVVKSMLVRVQTSLKNEFQPTDFDNLLIGLKKVTDAYEYAPQSKKKQFMEYINSGFDTKFSKEKRNL